MGRPVHWCLSFTLDTWWTALLHDMTWQLRLCESRPEARLIKEQLSPPAAATSFYTRREVWGWGAGSNGNQNGSNGNPVSFLVTGTFWTG